MSRRSHRRQPAKACWRLSKGTSKPFFEALFETFLRDAEAGVGRDNAGRHGAANFETPYSIRLIYLPPHGLKRYILIDNNYHLQYL
jgi:hypothetical protein